MSIIRALNPLRSSNDSGQASNDKLELGFWLYLMTDCVLFASLFAAYIVLAGSAYGGRAEALFSMPFVLVETFLLLASSYTCGLAVLAMHREKKNQLVAWLSVTFLLGLAFLSMELYEFGNLLKEGESWTRSGFLSGYFTLVGTHGIHITIGLIWLITLITYLSLRGLNGVMRRRLMLFSLFWHFLDIIWIFIFTIVYLLGSNI